MPGVRGGEPSLTVELLWIGSMHGKVMGARKEMRKSIGLSTRLPLRDPQPPQNAAQLQSCDDIAPACFDRMLHPLPEAWESSPAPAARRHGDGDEGWGDESGWEAMPPAGENKTFQPVPRQSSRWSCQPKSRGLCGHLRVLSPPLSGARLPAREQSSTGL